jgi:hypothetical protein
MTLTGAIIEMHSFLPTKHSHTINRVYVFQQFCGAHATFHLKNNNIQHITSVDSPITKAVEQRNQQHWLTWGLDLRSSRFCCFIQRGARAVKSMYNLFFIIVKLRILISLIHIIPVLLPNTTRRGGGGRGAGMEGEVIMECLLKEQTTPHTFDVHHIYLGVIK